MRRPPTRLRGRRTPASLEQITVVVDEAATEVSIHIPEARGPDTNVEPQRPSLLEPRQSNLLGPRQPSLLEPRRHSLSERRPHSLSGCLMATLLDSLLTFKWDRCPDRGSHGHLGSDVQEHGMDTWATFFPPFLLGFVPGFCPVVSLLYSFGGFAFSRCFLVSYHAFCKPLQQLNDTPRPRLKSRK